jgi:hypothetical protein
MKPVSWRQVGPRLLGEVYGCRHTWITRALDNEDFTIQDGAEMAGTSIEQIERTYKTVGRRQRKLFEFADKVHRNSRNIE